MAIKNIDSLSSRRSADALILPFFEENKPAFPAAGKASLYKNPLESGDFSGKKEEVVVHYPNSSKEKRIVLIGLGKEKELTAETLRRAYSKGLRAVKSKAKALNVQLPKSEILDEEIVTKSVAEGLILANYLFNENKSEKEKAVSSLVLIGAHSKALKEAEILCKSVCFARDLVFNNADVVTPAFLGEVAKEFEHKNKLIKTTVLGAKQIEKQGLGLLHAVSRGSIVDPALIIVEYRGDPKSKETTALVGKGVTYDTGGLSLKPTAGMLTMRDDMAGAASVLGTIHAISALKLPVNVIGVIGSTENSMGPGSYKLGDVYRGYSGVTVEVTNTDAEGRLVLADALSYVQKNYKPTRIINIASLTGGVVVALGEELTGCMSNDDALSKELEKAGEETYERLWRLPIYEEYNDLLKSKVADIKNSGGRLASPIQGAIFLKKFIEKKSGWAHLDIGGTAFPDSLKPYQPVQASGVGVRLLTKYLQNTCL